VILELFSRLVSLPSTCLSQKATVLVEHRWLGLRLLVLIVGILQPQPREVRPELTIQNLQRLHARVFTRLIESVTDRDSPQPSLGYMQGIVYAGTSR